MTWPPNDSPDPQAILDSAKSDTRDGAYARALEKFLWFHHNAVRYDPRLDCVRLSFALGDWWELAEVYLPARDALVRTRDETEASFREEPFRFELFHDLAALNGYCLGDGARTAELFVTVVAHDHELAQELYSVAEPYLIAAGRHDVCGPFLHPQTRLRLATDRYKDESTRIHDDELSRLEEEMEREDGIPKPNYARNSFVKEVATVLGLLAINRRAKEARWVRDVVLAVLDDEEFRKVLDAAMNGHLPTPGHQELEVIRRRRREQMEQSSRYLQGSDKTALE